MSFIRPSAAKQTTQTTGTGTLALIANTGDTRSIQQALGSGPIKGRFMLRGQGYFEMFRGTFTAPSTLTRDEVIISSNANNLVNVPPGTTDVYLLDYAQFMVDTFTANRTLTNADGSNSLIFKGSAFCTLTLHALSAALPDFWMYLKNEGTASFSVACAGSDINDENALGFTWLDPGEDAWIFVGEGNALWRISRNRAGAPGRNKIINGDFRLDQRNAGAAVTPAATTYTVDRWALGISQASKLTAQLNAGAVTPPLGNTNYFGITTAAAFSVAAGDFFRLYQVIEGLNCHDLGWGAAGAKPVTLSFWAYSSLTGTFGGSLTNSASNRSYPFSYSIPVANTWTYIAVTVPGDTAGTWLKDTGAGITVSLGLGVGSTFAGAAGAWASTSYFSATGAVSVVGTLAAKFYFTGVQLEAGTCPTPFEARDIVTEFARCQRYYQVFTDPPLRGVINATNAAGRMGMALPVPMRVAPSASISGSPLVFDGTGNTGVATLSASHNSQQSVELDLSLSASTYTVGRAACLYQSAGGKFIFDAEI